MSKRTDAMEEIFEDMERKSYGYKPKMVLVNAEHFLGGNVYEVKQETSSLYRVIGMTGRILPIYKNECKVVTHLWNNQYYTEDEISEVVREHLSSSAKGYANDQLIEQFIYEEVEVL